MHGLTFPRAYPNFHPLTHIGTKNYFRISTNSHSEEFSNLARGPNQTIHLPIFPLLLRRSGRQNFTVILHLALQLPIQGLRATLQYHVIAGINWMVLILRTWQIDIENNKKPSCTKMYGLFRHSTKIIGFYFHTFPPGVNRISLRLAPFPISILPKRHGLWYDLQPFPKFQKSHIIIIVDLLESFVVC